MFLFIKLNKVLQEWNKICFRCFRLFLFPFSARSEKCSDRFLHCLSQVPCGSLIAWIILLVGLGGLTGGLLIGAQKTRDMLDNDQLWVELSYLLKTFIFYSCLLILQSSEVFIGCSRHFVKKNYLKVFIGCNINFLQTYSNINLDKVDTLKHQWSQSWRKASKILVDIDDAILSCTKKTYMYTTVTSKIDKKWQRLEKMTV